jgi:hypothetical protein
VWSQTMRKMRKTGMMAFTPSTMAMSNSSCDLGVGVGDKVRDWR